MKAKITISSGIILLSLLFFYNSIKAINNAEGSSQVFNPGKKFLITAMHSGFHPTNPFEEEFSSYALLRDTLRFNGWHRYGSWFDSDRVFNVEISTIEQGITNTVSHNNQHELRTIFDRPITRYLSYGQRSDYQCEQIPEGVDYYFHAYDNSITNTYVSDINDYSFNGGGAKVKHASLNASSPGVWAGYLVKDLRSNREQCNRIIDHTRDDTYPWYVKPRIRIDTAFANNQSNPNDSVCRIDILDWNGFTTKSVKLLANHFHALGDRYNGNYIEEYYLDNALTPNSIFLDTAQLCPYPIRNAFNWDTLVYTDFRVYWYGRCEMYIDYIRVENEPARQLFDINNVNHNYLMSRLTSEINIASAGYDPNDPVPNNFYTEEFEFNMTPSIQFLSRMIDSVSQGRLTFMANLNMEMYNTHIPRFWERHVFNAAEFKKYLLDNSKIKYVLPNPYFLEGWKKNDPLAGSDRESYNPNTLPIYSLHSPGIQYDSSRGLLTYPISPEKYDSLLQNRLDDMDVSFNFKKEMKIVDELSRISSVDIIDLHQSHMWNQSSHKLKEPTNEELEMTANVAISYGAKGIMYFAYNGVCEGNGYNTTYEPSGNPPAYSTGFVDKNKNIRDINAYGQNKWNFYKRYNRILEKWGPYLMSFDNNERRSYIYRKPEERSQMLSDGQFMNEVFTYKPITDSTASIIPEPINDRYLQIAFFTKHPWNLPYTSPESQYFMVTNRRCSPHYNNSSEDNIGGKRNVKVKISPFSLGFQKFRNVSLMDLGRDSILTTFYNENNINSTYTLDLGWFEPGEAKLFQIAPTLHMGGSLVSDETIYNVEFTCEGNVNTNGHVINVADSTIINFTSSGKLNVNGGNFAVYGSNPSIIFRGLNNQSWSGINLNNGLHLFSYVKFENTTGQAIKGENCDLVIQDCIFDVNSRAVQLNNSGSSIFDAYINNNRFNISNTSATTCNLIANAGGQINSFINNNEFNGNNSGVAIYSNSGTGTIKNNIITNYKYGIYLSTSSFDISGNNINSAQINASGISGVSLSGMNLGINSSKYITGGLNTLSITGTNSSDISVVNSTFNILNGYNTFNINSLTSFHFNGTFPSPFTRTYPDIDSRNNCFRYSNAFSSPSHSVLWLNSNNTSVNFLFFPYSCQIDVPDEESIITELSGGVTDTIYKAAEYDSEEISTDQLLYDSLNLSLRKLDYENAMSTSKILLTNFGDSSSSTDLVLDAITKLYASTVSLDSIDHTNMIQLKTFFESLILNNPENIELISKTFYYLQKCKVVLGDYTSAISGFQQFIDQNPYSYEALVASWDLDATSLLDTLGGTGGGEKIIIDNSDLSQDETMKSIYLMDDPKDKYDTKVFNKEDRKLIRENVYNSLNLTKNTRNEILKVLEVKVSEGTANQNEKREFENAKVLKELVKPKNPRTIDEHFNNVDNDINKILDLNNSTDLTSSSKSLIPTEYNLSQNYPNPFNPTTKISFELPADAKVKLIVYDMLGREVKSLVNTQLSTGRYEYQFEGSNFSSGIYFYRIEAVDNSGKKFVQTKRMVLVR
jgi:tetratricopeptide (TPR) repeat protein